MFLFINRKEELSFLEERYSEKGFEFIVIYGRRRIGKTELIKNFIKNKPHIYFLCDKTGTQSNALRFRKEVASFMSEPEIASESFRDIFSYILSKTKNRPVIVLDEFSYLVEKDDAIPSVFQSIADEILKGRNIMLIICGSSMSMMEKLLGRRNPLYGRKTGHMKIDFIRFKHFKDFFPRNSTEENIKTYAILGGVPFYMDKFDKNKAAIENAREQILSKKGRLYEEVDFLLKEELREPDVYKAILSAIASGSTKVVEIAAKSGIKASDMDRYLKVLIMLGIVKREIPATERKSKRTLYVIDDNFFDFYTLFYEPHKSEIEIGEMKNLIENLNKNFNAYAGKKFEKLIRTDALLKLIPFSASRIGRWWGFYREGGVRKELEIDIVALNDNTKEILFAECKWQDNVDAKRILSELKEKEKHVQWHNESRKEHYAIFAKSFKEKIKEPNLLLFDLKDLEKCFSEL